MKIKKTAIQTRGQKRVYTCIGRSVWAYQVFDKISRVMSSGAHPARVREGGGGLYVVKTH